MIETSLQLRTIPLTQFAGYFEYALEEHEVQPSDNWFDVGLSNLGFTNIYGFWNLNPTPKITGTRKKEGKRILEIYIEPSRDKHMHLRSVYTVVNWLKDVGGLFKGLTLFGTLLVMIRKQIRGDPFKLFLIDNIFKTDGEKKDKNDRKEPFIDIETQQPPDSPTLSEKKRTFLSDIKDRKRYKVPPFICYGCCRPQKKVIDIRLERMYQELDIVRFIKQQKQVRLAMKTIFTRLQYYLLLN